MIFANDDSCKYFESFPVNGTCKAASAFDFVSHHLQYSKRNNDATKTLVANVSVPNEFHVSDEICVKAIRRAVATCSNTEKI